MLQIQKEIQKLGLNKVVSKYKLKLKDYPTKILLKYDQIESKKYKGKQAVREARGIILEKDTWKLLSLPFIRFFNLGEKEADVLDWDSTMVHSKMDGSVIALYWDYTQYKWCVQTSGTAEADTPVPMDVYEFTFANVFWQAAENYLFNIETVNSKFNKDLIYVFELQTPYNRVVIHHDKCKLTLLTIRNQKTAQEIAHNKLFNELEKTGVSIPIVEARPFSAFKSLEDIVEFVNDQDGSTFEGFVLVDKNFQRIKIKSRQYVEFSLLSDKLNKLRNSKSSVVKIIQQGEQDEFLAIFQEHTALIKEYEEKYNKMELKLQKAWLQVCKDFKIKSEKDYKNIVRKSYAIYLKNLLEVRNLDFSFPLFIGIMDDKEFNIDEFLQNRPAKILYKYIENIK